MFLDRYHILAVMDAIKPMVKIGIMKRGGSQYPGPAVNSGHDLG